MASDYVDMHQSGFDNKLVHFGMSRIFQSLLEATFLLSICIVSVWSEAAASNDEYIPVELKHLTISVPKDFKPTSSNSSKPDEEASALIWQKSSDHMVMVEIYERRFDVPEISSDLPAVMSLGMQSQRMLQDYLWVMSKQRRSDKSIELIDFKWNLSPQEKFSHSNDSRKAVCTHAALHYFEQLTPEKKVEVKGREIFCFVFWLEGQNINRENGLLLMQIGILDGWGVNSKGQALSNFDQLALDVLNSLEMRP